MLRHVLAVAAGFTTWTVLFLGLAMVIQATFPEDHGADGSVYAFVPLLIYVVIAVAASVAAGYAAHRVATEDADRVVIATAVLLLVVGIAVQVTSWSLTPVWYNLVFLAVLVPATIGGGRLAASDG